MKKTLFLLFIMGLSISSIAQEKKFWLGGNVGFSSGKNGNTDVMNWQFGPEFAFMFNEKMAVGLNLGLNGNSNDDANNKVTNTNMRFTPFYRMYFGQGEKFKFFGQANVYFETGTNKNEDKGNATTTETKTNGFGVTVVPGVQYWFNPSFSMLANWGSLGYTSSSQEVGNTTTDNNEFGLKVDLTTINWALIWHF